MRSRRVAIAAVIVLLAVGAAAVGLRRLWDTAVAHVDADRCRAGAYQVSPDQAAVASTMVGVVLRRALPERAATLVLAAALQESKISNVPAGDGDRDSVGVLQQRPSQGWGTVAQLSDVRFATGAFLDVLVEHADWQQADLAQAIQDVQISADRDAYAQHEGRAQALADALTGTNPAGLRCDFDEPATVASAATVADEVRRNLPVNVASTQGGTVRVPGAAWATAAWFVANADRLGIERVAYAGRAWQRGKPWTAEPAAGTDAVIATLHG